MPVKENFGSKSTFIQGKDILFVYLFQDLIVKNLFGIYRLMNTS